MIIAGSVDIDDTRQHDKESQSGHATPDEEQHSEKDVVVVIIGALLLCIGLAFITFYFMYVPSIEIIFRIEAGLTL